MEIIIGKTAGFCMGVQNAVEKAKAEVEKNENNKTYCIGNLVHNPQVMNNLKEKGLCVIQNLNEIINQKGKKVIFRAHGVTKQTYEEAKKLELEVIDLTCPSVLAIHKIAKREAENKAYIFLIGEKVHPEVIATASFCGEKYDVIETEEELNFAIKNFKQKNENKLLIIAQTTFSLEKFEKFVKKVQNEFTNEKVKIDVKNTICNATKLRQDETIKLAQNVNYMLVIGGKNSANTNKLYDIAKKNCQNALMIESKEELSEENINKIKEYNKIGIMAGASTPNEAINEIKQLLEQKL